MSRFHPPRKTVGQSKCRSTSGCCLSNRHAVSRVLSCGSREASTSRIANQGCPDPEERIFSRLVERGFASSSLARRE